MANFETEVRRILQDHGCFLVRQGKGDHEIWYSPITFLNFPVPTRIKSRHTANEIMKQAGLADRF